MIRISSRDNIHKLKSLQHIHDNLLDKMFNELGSRFQHKELSDRFWEVIPADIRNKYKESVIKIRDKIRDIIREYPEYYTEYQKKNSPYFRKMEKKRTIEQNQPIEEEQLVEVSR